MKTSKKHLITSCTIIFGMGWFANNSGQAIETVDETELPQNCNFQPCTVADVGFYRLDYTPTITNPGTDDKESGESLDCDKYTHCPST